VPAAASVIAEDWSGLKEIGWQAVIDGAPFVVERGCDGDHRFVHGEPPDHSGSPSPQTRAIHHLSADVSVLQCAPADQDDLTWWRLLLDSVLFTIALLHGYEALHAGAIATPNGAIAITATTGGGKSTLLTELLSRGHVLLADDVLVLQPRATQPPLSYPAAPLMTIPAARVAMLSMPQPPDPIAALGEERWIAFPTFPRPLELKALVVLDRQPTSQPQPSLCKIEAPLAALLGALMSFPDTVERQRARFELASSLASTVGLWRLTASADTPPDALADALLAVELWK
jgi:hypothetical protein